MYNNFSYFSCRDIQNPHWNQNIIVIIIFKHRFPQRLMRSDFKNDARGEILPSLR